MCGFVGAFDGAGASRPVDEELRNIVLDMSRKIRHRGPDWSGVYAGGNAVLSHERLAIVDPLSGRQPLLSADGKLVLAANGEIYNHQEIRRRLEGKYLFQTGSDCEVILALYREKGVNFFEDLSGIFAFALYDAEKDVYLVGRDEIGVIPLYQGWDKEGRYYVASELKALEGVCATVEEFPNGCYFYSPDKQPVRWYHRDWESFDAVKNSPCACDASGAVIHPEVIAKIRTGLEDAVRQQLMSDVPYGVLLSGGLDSSIIAAVTQKYSKKRVETGSRQDAWWPQLHSFAVGLEGSPDLAAARKAAESIGTVHHEVHFTIQEALDALPDVIYHIETYDITTVRASTPMYLLARAIKALHKEFIDTAMRLNPADKMSIRLPDGSQRMEKWILRKAFEDLLPADICWRQKEQFSDGVGYSWIDTLKEMTSQKVSDAEFAQRARRFPVNTPVTKEEYFYRDIFSRFFPEDSAAMTVPHEAGVACSTAKALEWDAAWKSMDEPSGRAIAGVHEKAYES